MQLPDNEIEKIKRLVLIREKLGINQKEMAELLGILKSGMSRIEGLKDNRKLPKNTSYVLEEKFGISRLWFETGEGEMYTGATTDENQTLSNMNASYEIESLKDQLQSKIELIESMKENIQLLKEANLLLKQENQHLKLALGQKGKEDDSVSKAS